MEDLARLSFKRKPLYVGIDDSKAVSTREGLEQGYCVVPSAQRFLLLFTFLKKNLQKKVLGFRSTLLLWIANTGGSHDARLTSHTLSIIRGAILRFSQCAVSYCVRAEQNAGGGWLIFVETPSELCPINGGPICKDSNQQP